MDTKMARNRAVLSGKLTNVLDSRTLANSHKRLKEILTEGMTILDVGCGTGSITYGIAEEVGPNGRVVGIDSNPNLIKKARQAYGETPGLFFETGDIYNLPYDQEFDIVTASRVLIWLSEPLKALKKLTSATKIGGRLIIVDYNHEKINWQPQPPSSMLAFYSAYLKWRSEAGMDNSIADNLPNMFQKIGIGEITITPQHELTTKPHPEFQTRIGIWADTASSRGVQMVRDGFITEKDYLRAENEYREWMVRDAESLMMYMLAVEGKRLK
ncbi:MULTISPECIES: class I SAM-dependent methyltransferase [Bacillaceae]|uniref:class I SAM-dependent methyltransferase n=1 Tax=Bacillaceae TaxID=186817 RepID=UPI001E3C45B8|nr:methyltransferase domain-containing protein [Bacillus sp. Au-Bac7]MCE4048662.1 methyltransferase domain-containing protein [Bacillus sp. Au-Bac7]